MVVHLRTVHIVEEADIVTSRRLAREIAAQCNFVHQDQSRISTVVSELARYIVNHADQGTLEFSLASNSSPKKLLLSVESHSFHGRISGGTTPGNEPAYAAIGVEVQVACSLMDESEVSAKGEGMIKIDLAKYLPANAPIFHAFTLTQDSATDIATSHAAALAEVREQNKELLIAMHALRAKQAESDRYAAELTIANGVTSKLNAQLSVQAATLMQADAKKDEFLAILSHELRGPLGAAGMAAQLLSTSSMSEDRVIQLGNIINRQVGQMTRLVEDLLDVSRVSRGLIELKKRAVDMCQIIEDAVEQVRPSLLAKGHTLNVDIPHAPCIVMGDESRLVQVVSNLLSNSIRYTPNGGRITVSLVCTGGQVFVHVLDNGIGLQPEKIPFLFDIYVQAERSTDKTGGLGLGLALVKSLIEAHEGTVFVKSDGPNKGSVFSFVLSNVSAQESAYAA